MDIVKKIDKLRKEKGWSINKLAVEAMLTQSTVSNMFKSGAEPKISTLKCICDALGVTLSDFFYEGDTPLVSPKNLDMLSSFNSLSIEQQKVVFDLIKVFSKKA